MKKIFLVFFCLITNFIFAIDVSNISNEENSLTNLQVEMNSSGQAIAAWQNNRYHEKSIIEFATSSDFGKTWSEPQFIGESTNIEKLKIIINESDEIMCLWEKEIDYDYSILELAISYDFGRTWTITQSDEMKYIMNYSIKNINDIVFIIWGESTTCENKGIYIKKSTDFGRTWKNIKCVDENSYFKIFLHESGHFLIAWDDSLWDSKTSAFQKLIKYSISNNFGDDWSEIKSISLNTNEIIDIEQCAIDDNGHVIIIWLETKKDDNGEYSTTFHYSYSSDNTKSWSEPTILEKGLPSARFWHPKLTLDSSGKMIFIWQAESENYYEEGDFIKVAISSDFGKTWASSKIISDKDYHCCDPFIKIDSNENVLVTWVAQDLYYSSTLQSRYSSDFGINWDPIIDLSNKQFIYHDPIVVNSKGKVILLWKRYLERKKQYQRIISSDFGKSWE
ncbi:MAG: hypothetical protein KR126chlam4_00185 [Candidatus Anoxychlamydiales bacterium]|nr:hypothetical protein [Candidatus Anoxychlamydiales bacterium]NGX40366.1 hypothetical protein [Candidatus Anoxychlamydiales bacterium]HEU64477.1 exo-alpha-sialidase [Chlamydiota bacterium]